MMKKRKIIILSTLFIFIANMSFYSQCTMPGAFYADKARPGVSYADKARFLNYCHFVGKNPKALSYAEMVSSFELGMLIINDMTSDNELRNNETMRNLFKYKLWVDSPQGDKVDKQGKHALAHLIVGPGAFAIADNGIGYVSDRVMQTEVAKDITQLIPERLCMQKKHRDFLYDEGKFIFASLAGVTTTILTEGKTFDEKKIRELGDRVTCKVGTDLVEQFIIAPLSDKIMGAEKESSEKEVVNVVLSWLALVGIRQIVRLRDHQVY